MCQLFIGFFSEQFTLEVFDHLGQLMVVKPPGAHQNKMST